MKGKPYVLIAEDDSFVGDIYRTKLEEAGIEVEVALDGKKALEKMQEHVPDVLLLDILMPYMDGMDVLRELQKKEAWKNIPVLMLTNLSEKENIQQALSLGARGYIIKSHFTPAEVLAKVQELLAESSPNETKEKETS